MAKLDKWLKNISFILLILFAIVMPLVTYSNWHNQQMFKTGEKKETTAIVRIDENKVKTYDYPENDYGVDARDSKAKDGESVTLYYLKNQPDMVSEKKDEYIPQKNILISLGLSVFFIVLVFWKISKRIKEKSV